jgi:alpha-2-macroglobulin
MKTKFSAVFLLVIMAAALSCQLFTGCKSKKKEITQADPGFIPYISAYTTGILSSVSNIRIRLSEPSPAFAGENKPAAEKLFDFSPSVEGQTIWIDKQTVEFRPSTPMIQDQVYDAKFFLGKVRQVDSKFEVFEFGFSIMKQAFEVVQEGLIVENSAKPEIYTYEGKLNTADVLDPGKLKDILSAEYKGKEVDISWINDPEGHHFTFRISNILRDDHSNILRLAWSGSPIGVDNSAELNITIPPKQFFGKLSDRYTTDEGKALLIYFSDPLDPGQDLRGIITTNNDQKVSYGIQSNILKVVFAEDFEGSFTLQVSTGLKNAAGKKLEAGFEINNPPIIVYSLKPQVRAVGKGCILPTSQGLVFPFEAVSLKSVRLTIIKIFENNIAQFLQENDLSGSSSMKRVGRPVFSKIIPLTNSGVTDFSKWDRFTFDLNDFIKADPGAIYQINVTFNKNNILYPCQDSTSDEQKLTQEEFMRNLDEKWSNPSGNYYDESWGEDYDYTGYDWHERDNPCNPAYYMDYYGEEKKMISQNILATDIGLILKRGTSGDVFVAVTDIRTAQPMPDVELQVLDYQLQELYKTRSNTGGLATFRLERKPFLLIAKKGDQRSYLRIDDGSSLSLSNFDVSGDQVQKGLKGFLYGERGVWRPGDSLFVTFILQDKQNTLPAGHPIVFELKNPSGQLVSRLVKPNDKSGMFTFCTVTAPEAPTGKWSAIVKTGGSLFTIPVRIETVKPNRLKVNFQLDKKIPFGENGRIEAQLHAQWLHGGTAGNLKATYEVLLMKAKAEFKSYKNFIFDDPSVSLTSEYLPVFDGKLNAEGNADIRCNLKLEKKLPSAMNAYFRGKVFEPGGNFSVDFLNIPIFPYEAFIGMHTDEPKNEYWFETGKDHTVFLASVNKSGQPVSLKNLDIEIFKMRWSWWWQEEGNWNAEYVESTMKELVKTQTVSTINGKGSFKFRFEYPDWGRYLIRVTNPSNGQSCGQFVYVDWPYSYGRSDANLPGGATMLGLSSDKKSCKVNESVKITIPGMPGARALVSIENGSRVLKAYWVDAGQTENVEEIKTATDMTPNVFIYVTVIQPHKDKKNDLPIRQYGVISLDVEDPGTVLNPVIRMPDRLKPEQKFSVSVSEKNGKPMVYTIAVVDEGLLDLTHFKTPDPHKAFFAHEALGVKTFDLFDQIIGAYGGRLERLLSIGGDEVLKQEEKGKNLRFKPVVRFLGPFTLAAGGTASHSIVMPNYIGSVRTMVVATSPDSYGFAEKTVPVKQDLMIMATLPRVLRPGEEVDMPINVFVMNKSVKTVTVTIKVNKYLTLPGSNTQTIAFSGEGDKIVYFRLKSVNLLGMGKVEVVASGNNIKSTSTIEIPIVHASSMVHKSTDFFIPSGQAKNLDLDLFGFPGTNSASIELSQVEKINFTPRIKQLIDYPYGCAEQTTSITFAQLFLSKIVELGDDETRRTENHIREGISRLSKFQTTGGGFLYWPGAYSTDDWITSYVGHFLLEAIKTGYTVPDFMISRWKNYQQSAAKKWTIDYRDKSSQLVQAYRLYTLALSGSPDFSDMNRLREIKDMLPQATWRLAAAYALSGKREIALEMTASLPVQFPVLHDWSVTYGSRLRDQAMVLETLTELDQSDNAALFAKEISMVINKTQWLSTQECAYSLLALAKYYSHFLSPNPISASITLNGREMPVKTSKFSVSQSLSISETKKNTLSVSNKSGARLIVCLTESGIPLKDDEISFRKGLSMSVTFMGKDGKPIDVKRLKQGTEFRVIVEIGSTSILYGCKNLALRQLFPSGWEITNTRFQEPESDNEKNASNFTYQDIRDDRVYTFFDLVRDKKKKFELELTATYSGRYFFPGTLCEAMYDNETGAKDEGMWIEVVPE